MIPPLTNRGVGFPKNTMPQQSQPRAKTFSASLDYLALSSPKNPIEHLRFMRFGGEVQKAVEGEETEIKPSGIRGYKGQKIAGVSFAHRASDNHYVLQV